MSTRELAILIWLLLLASIGLLFSETRKLEMKLLKIFFQILAQPAFILIFSYQEIVFSLLIATIIRLSLSWWLLKDYLIFFVTAIIGYLGEFQTKTYLKKLFASFGLAALVNFLLSTFTFSLTQELFFIPSIFLLIMLQTVLKNHQHLSLVYLINCLLIFTSTVIFILTCINIIDHPQETASINFWSSFLLSGSALLVNFPLILVSNVLYQFDQIDNLLTKSAKTSLLLFCQIIKYYLLKLEFHFSIVPRGIPKISKIEQRGFQNCYFRVTVSSPLSLKERRSILLAIQSESLPKQAYSNQQPKIPIWIRIQDNHKTTLCEWEIPHLLKEFQEKELFLYEDF